MNQAPTRGAAHEMRAPRSIDKLKSSDGDSNSNIPSYTVRPYYGNHNSGCNDEDLKLYHSAKELQVNISHETAATEPESDNEEDESGMYVSLGRNNSDDTDDHDGEQVVKPRYSEQKELKQNYTPQRQSMKTIRPSVAEEDKEEVEMELGGVSACSYDEASEFSALTSTPVRSHQKVQAPRALEEKLEGRIITEADDDDDDDDQVSYCSTVARLKKRFEKDAARDAALAKHRTMDPPLRKTTVQVQESEEQPRAMPAATTILHGTCPTVPEVEAVYYPRVDQMFGDEVETVYHTMGSHASSAPDNWDRSHFRQDPPEMKVDPPKMMVSIKKVQSFGSSTSGSTASITDSSDDYDYSEQQKQKQKQKQTQQAGATGAPFVSPYQPQNYPAVAFPGHPYQQLHYPPVGAFVGYPYPTAAAFACHPYQHPQYSLPPPPPPPPAPPSAPAVAGRGDHRSGFDQPLGSIDFPEAGTMPADPNPFVQWGDVSEKRDPIKCENERAGEQPPSDGSSKKNNNVEERNGQPSDSPPHVRRVTWEQDLMGGFASQKSMPAIKEDDDMLKKYFSSPQFTSSGQFDDAFSSSPFEDKFFSSSENPFKNVKQNAQNPGETPDRTCCDFEDDGFFSQFSDPFKGAIQNLQNFQNQGVTPIRTCASGTNDVVAKDDQLKTEESKPSLQGVMEDPKKEEPQKLQDQEATPIRTTCCEDVTSGTNNNVAKDDQLTVDESNASLPDLIEDPLKENPQKFQDQGETTVPTTHCDTVSAGTKNVAAKDDQPNADESKPSPRGVMDSFNEEPQKLKVQGETHVQTTCCDFVEFGSNNLLANDDQLNTEEPQPSSRAMIEEAYGLSERKNGHLQMEDQNAISYKATTDQKKSAQADEPSSQTTDAPQTTAADWITQQMNLAWNISSMLQKKEACDAIGSMGFKDEAESTNAEDKEETAADDGNTSFEQMFARLSVFAGYLQNTVATDTSEDKEESTSLRFCSASDVLPTKSFFESSSDENVTQDDSTAFSFGGNSFYSSSLFAAGGSKSKKAKDKDALTGPVRKVPEPRVAGSSWRPSVREYMAGAAAPGTDRLGSINDTL